MNGRNQSRHLHCRWPRKSQLVAAMPIVDAIMGRINRRPVISLPGCSLQSRRFGGDLAGWFFVGIAIAAVITTLIPDDFVGQHLGGGLGSMLLMLVVGVPMYICATASTPIAAALILKGVSPGGQPWFFY